jgi:hypothetical protein
LLPSDNERVNLTGRPLHQPASQFSANNQFIAIQSLLIFFIRATTFGFRTTFFFFSFAASEPRSGFILTKHLYQNILKQ